MNDGAIKGTGNSRFLKSVSNFLTLYPRYEDFAAALIAGTLPIDLNGINAVGWAIIATALSKANLLSDTTAQKIATNMGVSVPSTVDGAFSSLAVPPIYQKLLSYTVGTTAQSISVPLSGFDVTLYSEIIVYGAIYGDTSNKGFHMTLNNIVGSSFTPYKDVYISSNSSSISGGSTSFGYIPTEGYGGLYYPTSIMVRMRPIYINGSTQVSIDYSGGDSLSGDAYSFIVVGAAGLSIRNDKLTSIQFIESTGNIIAGSTFNVYGVKI